MLGLCAGENALRFRAGLLGESRDRREPGPQVEREDNKPCSVPFVRAWGPQKS
jgi:hypothetical protein